MLRKATMIQAIFFTCAAIVIISTTALFLFTASGLSLFVADGYPLSDFFFGMSWNHFEEQYGIIPLLYGSFMTTLLTLIVSAPLAVLVALFAVEVAPARMQQGLRAAIELFAAVPSVVYGLLGLAVVVPWIRETLEVPMGKGILPAVIVLIFMVQPTMVAVTEDAVRNVSEGLREGAKALGATRWQTIWGVILPAARTGLISAMILGIGRAVGETMAVQMVIGNIATRIPPTLTDSAVTMPSVIVTEWPEATNSVHQSAMIMVAFLLLIITTLLIIVARRAGGAVAR